MTPQSRFGLRLPLVVAPMAPQSGPALVAASSNAGALGSLACAYLTADQIEKTAHETRTLTTKPFAINLFVNVPKPAFDPTKWAKATEATRGYRDELGLAEPVPPASYHPDFEAQFAVVMKLKPAVFSFVFGLLDETKIRWCREHGVFTVGTATTPGEARLLEKSGVDAVVAQGTEAGGHRGIFRIDAAEPGLGSIELTRRCAGDLKIPVIAAGGLMTSADIKAALNAGAQATQLGTAFLLSKEAATQKPHRDALTTATRTVLTRAFSGRLARGIPNRFQTEIDAKPETILPFPIQNSFTRDLRNRSAERGLPDFMSLWAGAGVAQIRKDVSAAQIIEDLRKDLA